jgi:benzoate membrane transport protein
MLKSLNFSILNAGFLTVLVGFTSSVVLVFQAAHTLLANTEQIGSWIFSLCLGMGVVGIFLSWKYKEPIVLAWSTSGAAVIVSTNNITLQEGIGAFIVSGILIILSGFSGWFSRINTYIRPAISSSILAGILFPFCFNAFLALKSNPFLLSSMLVLYVLGRKLFPLYSVTLILIVGIVISSYQHTFKFDEVSLELAKPIIMMPEFSFQAIITLAIPLFIVTLISQNIPGLAVLRSEGYKAPSNSLVGWTGIATTLLAPLGCYALNLATITAAICSGKDAHPDPNKRYIAAIFAGFFYILVGLFSTTIGYLLLAFPKELVIAVAGIALLSTLANALTISLNDSEYREASIVAFFVTISGVSFFGINSVLWGLLAGLVTGYLLKKR